MPSPHVMPSAGVLTLVKSFNPNKNPNGLSHRKADNKI